MEIRPSCSQTQLTALMTDAQTLSVAPEEGAGRAAPTPRVHPENKRAKWDSYFLPFLKKMKSSLLFFHLGKTGIDGGLLHKPSSVKWTLERAYLYSETWLQLICKVWHMVESGLTVEASWDLSWWKEKWFWLLCVLSRKCFNLSENEKSVLCGSSHCMFSN